MVNKEYQWDVYLKPNYLTQDDLNDCVADVLTRLQTQHNADIAAKIAAKTAQDKNAVLAILNQRDEEVKNCRGFTLEYQIIVDASGALPNEVTFVYSRLVSSANVTVHYVDDLGNPIANDTYSTVDPGIHPVYPEPIIPQDEYALMEPESVKFVELNILLSCFPSRT